MAEEVISHKLLSDLKYDVEALKKKLTQPDNKTNELILEIESLKESIHELTVIFQKSLEEVKEEDVSKTMKDKLQDVINQNQTIAQGMVAISDKLEYFMKGKPVAPAAQVRHSMGVTPEPGRVAPKPVMESKELHMPPPPPKVGKKRGLFN